MTSERGVRRLIFADVIAAFIRLAPYINVSRHIRCHKLNFRPALNLAILESAIRIGVGLMQTHYFFESVREQFFIYLSFAKRMLWKMSI